MDFMYNFKQAHKDRLEDAGVVQYRPADGFHMPGRNRRRQPSPAASRLRSVVTAIASFLTK
jgi:hypothetical protein